LALRSAEVTAACRRGGGLLAGSPVAVMTPIIDWDDPEARLDLLCRIGPARYNALLRKHQRARVVATVNGYRIRPVVSERFGTVFISMGCARARRLWRALTLLRRRHRTEGGD
jgi:hypothetical protein